MRTRSRIYMLSLIAAFFVATVVYTQFFHDPERIEAQEVFGSPEPTQEQMESRILRLQVQLAQKEQLLMEARRQGGDIPEGNAGNILQEVRKEYDRTLDLAQKIARKKKFQLDKDLLTPSSAIAER